MKYSVVQNIMHCLNCTENLLHSKICPIRWMFFNILNVCSRLRLLCFTSLYYCCCNITIWVFTVLCCTSEAHFYISLLPEACAHYKKVHWATSRAYNWCAKTFASLLSQPLDFWQPTVPSEWTAHLIMFHTLHRWGPFSNVHRSISQ